MALVPARDEARALPPLLAALEESGAVGAVVVVDNGSTDATARVARQGGARVVPEPEPGYGRACQRGLRVVAGWRPRPSVVLIVDADDPSGARSAGRIVEPLRRDEADLVTGARRPAGAVPAHARLGNRLICAALRGTYGWRGRDVGPLRGARLGPLLGLGLDDPDFGWNVQMQVRALRAGLRLREVPVPFRARTRGTSKISGSTVSSGRAGLAMLKTLVREIPGGAPRLAAPTPGGEGRGISPGRK